MKKRKEEDKRNPNDESAIFNITAFISKVRNGIFKG